MAMHRSGTSALSRTLNLLGCESSPNLMGADEYNESGYWESRPIYELNEKILSSGGGGWAEWMEFNPNWFRSSAMDRFRERAVACIEAEFGKSNLFVIKDPRLSLLMPFWRSVFESMDIEPVVIHTLRNPIEVAQSLERRNKFLQPKGLLLWLRYTLEGERGTRGLRRFFTTYDDLMDDYVGFIDRSQETLGLFWPRNSEKLRRELAGFLTSNLRHHRVDGKSLRTLDYAAKWVETTYEVLRGFAEHGEDAAGCAALDAVHAEFTAAGNAMGAIAKDNDERYAQLTKLHAERDEIAAKQIEAEREAAAAKAELDKLRQAKVELEQRTATLASDVERVKSAKAEIEQRQRAGQGQRETLLAEKKALEAAVAEARRKSEEFERNAVDLKTRITSAAKARD
ncbi:MAG: hypothetical protein ACLGIM_09795, partial [Alphaproteobacteria bacterium]